MNVYGKDALNLDRVRKQISRFNGNPKEKAESDFNDRP